MHQLAFRNGSHVPWAHGADERAPGAAAAPRADESEDRHPMSSAVLRNFIDGDYVDARGDTHRT
jgi:hypothetical protein